MCRIITISELVKDDRNANRLVDALTCSIDGYASAVATMEHQLQVARFRLDADEFRAFTTRLDQRRHIAHEAVVSALKAANRYLFRTFGFDKIPAGGLYDYDPLQINNREAVGEWACKTAKILHKEGIC